MRRIFFILVLLTLFLTQTTLSVDARSGCCSHHGGVCGCGCCDGTSLSAKCAPYYPQCSSKAVTSPTFALTPKPTAKPTEVSVERPKVVKEETISITEKKIISSPEPTSSPQTELTTAQKELVKTQIESEGLWGWLKRLFGWN